MTEYRQYVPGGSDEAFFSQIRINVAQELSRQCSDTDDPDEYFVEALANITERPSTKEGTWIHSYLNRPQAAPYLDTLYTAPFKVQVPFAKVREPVDMNLQELRVHMQDKAARNG